jgi:hypothetical protein
MHTNGPHKVRYTDHQFAYYKYEAWCHRCNWSFHKLTQKEAEDLLLWHLDSMHINPKWYENSDQKLAPSRWDETLKNTT